MQLDTHERDVDSRLCRTCGACCRVTFKLRDSTPRYRRFLRQIGYTLLSPPAAGKPDCCDKRHDATVDRELAEGTTYRCRIHGTGRYPELCEQFNCVSWAKANETYSVRNPLLASAQRALDRLRRSGELS